MKLKRTGLILLILSFSFMAMSCAMFQKAETDPLVSITTSYQVLGTSITSLHQIAINLRSSGKINDAQMVQYNTIFFKVQSAYIAAGTTLSMVITTSDTVKKKEYMTAFESIAGNISGLITELNTFLSGVNK